MPNQVTMSNRFCPTCKSDVDDAGGYCLLGHRLTLEPVTQDIAYLRAEVDQAFEQARFELAAAVTTTAPSAPARAGMPPPPPPPAPELSADAVRQRARTIWTALQDEIPAKDDPIEAFAPAPRMDWGPERLDFFSKPKAFLRRPSGASA